VQAEIARCAYGLPDNFAPLPRIFVNNFLGKSISDLRSGVGTMRGADHHPAFRALAISASASLFAFGSEAPPLHCFRAGYGCGDLSFRALLVELISDAYGVDASCAGKTVSALTALAAEYGLHASQYDHGKHTHGRRYLGGHMLQIFVPIAEADTLMYQSHPYGVPVDTDMPVSQWLTGQIPRDRPAKTDRKKKNKNPINTTPSFDHRRVDGQLRLLFRPEVFTDPARGRIYHYSGDWRFLGGSREMEGSRAAFVAELRQLLAPLLPPEGNLALRERLGAGASLVGALAQDPPSGGSPSKVREDSVA